MKRWACVLTYLTRYSWTYSFGYFFFLFFLTVLCSNVFMHTWKEIFSSAPHLQCIYCSLGSCSLELNQEETWWYELHCCHQEGMHTNLLKSMEFFFSPVLVLPLKDKEKIKVWMENFEVMYKLSLTHKNQNIIFYLAQFWMYWTSFLVFLLLCSKCTF